MSSYHSYTLLLLSLRYIIYIDVPCTDCLFDCVEFTVFLLWASVLHALNNILGVVMNAFIYMNVRVYIISRNGVYMYDVRDRTG